MRCCMTSLAIVLALIAFSPIQAMAKGPGGGGQGGNGGQGGSNSGNRSVGSHVSGNQQSGDHHVGDTGINLGMHTNTFSSGGQGMKSQQVFDAHNRPAFSGGKGEGRDSWRYRWDNGRWWFWGPDNRWMWYGNDGRWLNYGNTYVVSRPILEDFSGGPIKIVNPAKNGVALSYTLDGNAFTILPGYSQDLREDRAWVIQFSRGANLDQTRYGLQSGVYTFARTDHGWELYRSDFPQSVAPQAPIAPPQPPPMAPPTSPSPQ
jgi:hypothetical protein